MDRTENIIYLEQKGPETAEHQQFPGFQSVGKDEVGSSNPPSSSNYKRSNLTVWVLFLLISQLFEIGRVATKVATFPVCCLFSLGFEGVPDDLTGAADAFLICVGVHSEGDGGI